MRIVCASCATRYSIDDQRVPAGPFRIRCKCCHTSIVVQGRPPASGASVCPSAQAPEHAHQVGAERWHLVIGQGEVGPLTHEELREALTTGAIHGGTSVWRDGLADWTPLGQIEELRGLQPGLFDHLGHGPPHPQGVSGDEPAPGSEVVSMVASRNESSVLFSIANLHELARSDAPASASGLIDIRAMARSGAVQQEPGLPLSYVVPAAPLLVPLEASAPRPRWMLPVLVGIGAALGAAVVALLLVLLQQDRAVAEAPPRPVVQTPAHAKVMPAPGPVAPEPPAPAPARTVRPEKRRTVRAPSARRRHHPPASTAPARRVTPRPAPRPAPKPAPEPEDELTRLINAASGGKRGTPTATRAAPQSKPDLVALEKRHIEAGVRSVRGQVQSCFDRYRVPGQVRLKLTISPSGKMSRVEVHGLFAGTPTGACLRQAFLRARFPSFRPPALTIWFPVILH